MLRPAIWVPFVVIACLQLLVLWIVVSYHHPALLPIGAPLIKLIAGEEATHYPVLFFALPWVFFWVGLAVSAIFAPIAGGAATLHFARLFGFSREENPWRHALRKAPILIGAGVVLAILWYGIGQLRTLVPEDAMMRDAAVRWGVRGGILVIGVIVQSLLVYATAWIVLMGHQLWPAIRDSVRVTTRTLLPTLVAVGIPALLLFPFSWLLGQTQFVASHALRPELIAIGVVATILVEIPITFLLVGTVTRLFVWRTEGAQ